MITDFLKLSALDISQKLTNKDFSCQEITSAFLEHINQSNPELNSFVTITDELALQTAKKVDQKIQKGEKLSLLEGVPIAIKDNLCIENILTTCSSKMLYNFKPSYNASVIEKILNNNMPILGKTNMDEFAMGSSTETSYYGITKNPWDTDTVPGGSSGGSAAAVASFQAPLALGSDTGGSIRQPASFCGIVGMKPTYGLVSRFGLIAFASSLDQIGPFAKNIQDASALLSIISGHDKKDSTSQPLEPKQYDLKLNSPIKIGIPQEFINSLSPTFKSFYLEIFKKLEDSNILIEEINIPSISQGISTYYIIAPAEASSNLARFDGVRFGYRSPKSNSLIEMMENSRSEGFGSEVKRRILIGTYVLSSGYYDAYYKKAQQVRTLMKKDFQKAFKKFDIILSPTTPTPAFKHGEKTNPLEMYLNDIMTIPANLAGIPALSMPCGLINNKPMGLHLMSEILTEDKLFAVSNYFEKKLQFITDPYRSLS